VERNFGDYMKASRRGEGGGRFRRQEEPVDHQAGYDPEDWKRNLSLGKGWSGDREWRKLYDLNGTRCFVRRKPHAFARTLKHSNVQISNDLVNEGTLAN